jgi:hypothetical protein
MHKSATKCNETIGKWCKNKHGASKIIYTFETYHEAPRIAAYDETTSTEALQDDVDALDEARDVGLARATQYQQSLRNYHGSQVRPQSFMVGDKGIDNRARQLSTPEAH